MGMDTNSKFDEEEAFQKAFSEAAYYADLPKSAWSMSSRLFSIRNEPRKASAYLEETLKPYGWSWPEAISLLKISGKTGTHKQQCSAFMNFVFKKFYVAGQMYRAKRQNPKLFPYIQITRGPSVFPCPDHGDMDGKIISLKSNYLDKKPIAKSLGCSCKILVLSQKQYERLANK
jgi:hypothetical protein